MWYAKVVCEFFTATAQRVAPPPEQVLTICPAKSYEQLEGWSRRLGGLSFEELKGVQLGPKAKEGASLRGSGVRF